MSEPKPNVLILTPVKNARQHLKTYRRLINELNWPKEHLSLGLLESDSRDGTWETLQELRLQFEERVKSLTLVKRDFGFAIPPNIPRWAEAFQMARVSILARSRNQLLFRALRDEDWVLWIDVDVIEYPSDIIQRLMAPGVDIIHPHCVKHYGGETFDLNAWANHGAHKMHDLRGRGLVRLTTVGGTMLLVKADLHRDGLIFPPYRYGLGNKHIRPIHPIWGAGEIETEGFGAMALDMGHQAWGLPDLEIRHADN